MSHNIQSTDVIIIGAGPSGLFAVFECGMVKLKCHVIDALTALGGQCTALYPEKPIYDIPAHPKLLAGDLIQRLTEQAEPFNPVYHLGQTADKLTRLADGRWRVETNGGTIIEAPAVILAAGAGAFGPNRPPLDGIEAYEGASVHYFVTKREDFRGKRVVIAGGGDSAVDWALSLSDLAKSVHLVHRRPKFRAAPESAAKLESLAREGRIDLVIPYQLHGLEGDGRQLSAVAVATVDGQTRRIEADSLLAFFGLATSLGPIADWGLGIERNLISVDPATMSTSAKGIFAIGDICAYPGKLKLILTGFAEAAHAAHAAYLLVHPHEALHFQYSTSQGVPQT